MTYRERRLARAQRLEDWADKREAKAETAAEAAATISDAYPFGQPILVGHHSEKRHRREIERSNDNTRKSIEHGKVADKMREKADNIRSAADQAIYSDDADALERLTERVAGLEEERAGIVVYNASCRRGEPNESLLTSKQQENLADCKRFQPYAVVNGQMPTYVLSNLSGNIRRLKKRLASLEAKR